MGAAGGVGAGLGIMGGILGGVGDIIQAQNYKRPHLEDATGREKRLRDLAQSQLLAGGQQSLGGMALYNQMVPMLMGQLPGMRYVPGTMGETSGDMHGGGGSLQSYQQSLQNMQQAQAAQQKLTELKAQKKGTKAGGGAKKAVQKQIKEQKRTISSMPTVAERERQMFTSGAQQNPDIYNIRQGQAQGPQQSLASIRGAMDAMNGRPPMDFASIYQGAGGY